MNSSDGGFGTLERIERMEWVVTEPDVLKYTFAATLRSLNKFRFGPTGVMNVQPAGVTN